MGLRREIKNRLSKMNGRLRREGRRLASVLLCGVMVAGNLSAVPVSALADSDSDNEFTYEIERAALQEALQTAVSEGNTVNEDLEFAGEYAEEYEQLLEADGTLYELEPAIADDDDSRDKALSLRVFARIEGDIPVDSMYEIDGTEEIVFLVSNKTEETVTASVYVDGLETEAITILPADSIPVENESSVVGSTAVTSGTITGGPSGGGSGNGGSGGSAASTSLEIEETEKVTDEVVIEITDTAADDEMSTDSAIEDSSVSIVDENDSDSSTQTDENGMTDDDPTGNEQTRDDGEAADDPTSNVEGKNDNITDEKTADPDTDDRNANAADVDTKDCGEAADNTDNSNMENGDADAANENSKSEEDSASSDGTSDTTDAGDTDTSGETDTTGDSDTDASDDKNGGSKGDTAGDNDDSDITEDSDVSVLGSAISVHRGILLAAGKATASDADETASDSDASNAIEGITYESVQLDKKGTAAFVTTAADLKLNEVVLVEYTAQENDVAVTVKAPVGALPGGAQLSVSLYKEDSEEYAAAGESVGYDAEDETTGMAAIDITFYDEDGEEVEPLAPVTVNIDVSEIIPESADTSTIEVQHLTETEEGVEPVLVADMTEDTDGSVTVNGENTIAIAEFVVESFSTFTITWQKAATIISDVTTLVYRGENYIVSASYDVDAKLPEGVKLLAAEYEKDSETFQARYAEVAEIYGWKEDYTEGVRLFDISLYDSNDAEVEPAAQMQVTIKYLDQENEIESYTIAHFAKDRTETIAAETEYDGSMQIISFGLDSFSEVMTIDDGISVAAISGDTTVGVGNEITLTGSNGNNHTWTYSSTDGGAVSFGSTNKSSVTVTGVTVGTVTITHSYRSGWDTYTEEYTVTVTAASTIKTVEVYVAGWDTETGQQFSQEMLDLLGIKVMSYQYWFPAGTIQVDMSLLSSSTSPYANTEEDWAYILECLAELDTDALEGGTSAANVGNLIAQYAQQVIQDMSQSTGYYLKIIDATSVSGNYTNSYHDNLHLDMRFNTVTITYIYGNNDITQAMDEVAYDGNTAGSKVFIQGATMDYTPEITAPAGWKIVGYYTDPGCTDGNEWDAVGQPINEDTTVYIKLVPEDDVLLNYVVAVGEGTVTNPSNNDTPAQSGYENFNPTTGTAEGYPKGSTAKAVDGYEFEGWYLDEACTQPVDSSWVDADGKITPQKPEGGWPEGYEATYYAKFVLKSYDITITKVDTDKPETTLSGAVFHIYKTEIVVNADETETTTTLYYSIDGSSVTWVDDPSDAADIKTVGGTANVALTAGVYYMEEITAPNGYNLLTSAIEFTVEKDGTVTVAETDQTYATGDNLTLTVRNTAGSALPETGGPGTTPFRIAGLLLTSCSAYLIYKTLRRKGGWLGE